MRLQAVSYQQVQQAVSGLNLKYKSCSGFWEVRYALVGLEVDEFRTYSELLEESSTLSFPGLVLAQTTWQAMGLSPGFRLFRVCCISV
ncbi:MAG: hypothetical protein F6K41_14020 [Symploca sp. SIO3E6]|nr:hypothetical protein [Caldora sp. SIO3E6]